MADLDVTIPDAPYEPKLIYYPERDEYEYVGADVPTVAHDVGCGVAVLRDIAGRAPVGFSVPGAMVRDAAKPVVTIPDAAAKKIAEWLGYAWDGLSPDSVVDRGFPIWTHGQNGLHFQGGQEDLRRLAHSIPPSPDKDRIAASGERERELEKRPRGFLVTLGTGEEMVFGDEKMASDLAFAVHGDESKYDGLYRRSAALASPPKGNSPEFPDSSISPLRPEGEATLVVRLENVRNGLGLADPTNEDFDVINDAIAALSARPQPPQQPVAWRYHHVSQSIWQVVDIEPGVDPYLVVEPLYAAPLTQPVAREHYFAVDYTGCIHDAPDRESAITAAEQFAESANGGVPALTRAKMMETELAKAQPVATAGEEREKLVESGVTALSKLSELSGPLGASVFVAGWIGAARIALRPPVTQPNAEEAAK